jgi:hypothetical protein
MPSQSRRKKTIHRMRSAPLPTRETRSKRKSGARMTQKNINFIRAFYGKNAVNAGNNSKNSKSAEKIYKHLKGSPEERNRGAPDLRR